MALDDERFARSPWGRFVRRLLKALADGGATVRVATSDRWLQAGLDDEPPPASVERVPLAGYDETSEILLRSAELVEAALALGRGDGRPGCVLCPSWPSGLAAWSVSAALDVPLVTYLPPEVPVPGDHPETRRYWREMAGWIEAHARRFVTPTAGPRTDDRRAGGAPARFRHVRPGIPPDDGSGLQAHLPDFRALFAEARQPLIVLVDHGSVGVGLRLLPALAGRLTGAGLVAVLQADLDEATQRAVAPWVQAGRVTVRTGFAGRALEALFTVADVVLMPGTTVAAGLLAMEAMACGTPVIVSDEGWAAEIVQHGVSGLRVTGADVSAWCDAAAGLVDHPDRRERLAEAGRGRLASAYGLKACATRFARVLREAGAAGSRTTKGTGE